MSSAQSRWCVLLGLALTMAGLLFTSQSCPAASNFGPNLPVYFLHVSDQLSIAVMGHDDYARQVTILSDGTFEYPIIGTVHAAGMTVAQLSAYMTKGLSDELNQPELTISVTESLAQTISVLGAVGKAGSYTYEPDWRLVDALAAADGLTSSPDTTSITVVRTGGLVPFSINTVSLMDGQDPSQNMTLLPGDTVLVQEKDGSSTKVQVTGEVKIPGSYLAPQTGETPLAALIAAGGVTVDAALSESQLLHAGVVRTVDLRYVATDLGGAPSGVTLYPGDSLLIPTITRKVSVLGAVNNPATYNIPDGKEITVSEAVGMADGTLQGANLSKVTVLREIAGKPSVFPIDLSRIYAGETAATDVPIEPGDVVFVPARAPKAFRPQDLVLLTPFLQLMHL